MGYFLRFSVITGVLALWSVVGIVIFFWVLGLGESSYIAFGPSETLIVVGLQIKIDTWLKWGCLCGFQFIDAMICYYAYDTIFPWLNASILNVEEREIQNNKLYVWILVNLFYLVNAIKTVFAIGMSLTQIDLLVISQVGSLISGAIVSGDSIRRKTYAPSYKSGCGLRSLSGTLEDNLLDSEERGTEMEDVSANVIINFE